MDIIHRIPRGRVPLGVLRLLKFNPKLLIIVLLGNLIENDFLSVIGNLEDDVLGLSPSESEFVEGSDALRVNGDSINAGKRRIVSYLQKREVGGATVRDQRVSRTQSRPE